MTAESEGKKNTPRAHPTATFECEGLTILSSSP